MKKNFLYNLPLHTLVMAFVPIFSLLGSNIVEITFQETLRSLAWSLASALVILALWWLLTRNLARAGLAATYMLILFYTFGDVYQQVRGLLPEGALFAQANVLAALWAVLLILGTWAILRLLRAIPAPTLFCNVIALVVLVQVLYPIGMFYGRKLIEGPIKMHAVADLDPQASSAPAQKPDIYYIILDGYGRSDSLQQIHHVDNGDFLQFLEQRGFTIASQSTTNYARTMHSLTSSLNYHYLDTLFEPRPELNNYDAFRQLIKDNAVQRFLQKQGYHSVALATGFEITEVSSADTFLNKGRSMTYFEETLLSHTLAIFYVDQVVGDVRRAEINQAFAELEASVGIEGPKFVFAHLVVPHPPFVFDENGGPVAPRGWGDGTSYAGGPQQYFESYRRQLLYVDKRIEAIVTHLQENSAVPPVIIIQGDHGPGALVDWLQWENTCYRERMPILNAYFLPGISQEEVPQDITPVNTFRLVFNYYFGTQLPMEANRSYTVTLPQPYRFIEVTDRMDSCPALEDQP